MSLAPKWLEPKWLRRKRERDAFAAVKPLRKKATNDPTTTQFERTLLTDDSGTAIVLS